jgi:hypothetical protein
MSRPESVSINIPALPKGGGAIQSVGKGWGPVGPTGASSFQLALPISTGRGFDPAMTLGYSSSAGNGVFGIGWNLPTPAVTRVTGKGAPTYTSEDEVAGPDGVEWYPAQSSRHDKYNNLDLKKSYTVTRYLARVESAFDRIEHWSTDDDPAGFWLVHAADGTLHLFGRQAIARRADPADLQRVGEWLLQESVNASGEHIYYEYQADVAAGKATAQRYLSRVCYGNEKSQQHLYLWHPKRLESVRWHFELVLDYGGRDTGYSQKPGYVAGNAVHREDEVLNYAYGFELRTKRLCRQILMFHWFPTELGDDPQLVRRLLLDYQQTEAGYHLLSAAHQQAFDAAPEPESHPPVEFSYSEFNLQPSASAWTSFSQMPTVESHRMEWVDLYGEGLPGLLYRHQDHWRYREPLRGKPNTDHVVYGEGQLLPALPTLNNASRQSLSDLTGDGRLDWVIAQPAMSGFFSMSPNRSWTDFNAFNAFPLDFFNNKALQADLMGEGLADLAMIGPRSVRLYANQRSDGFSAAHEVARSDDEDNLPIFSDSKQELVAFSDLLGSGQQHLVRIRHDEIKVWPNLGRGRFGTGRVLTWPGLARETFDASRIRLADLDGSGAADLIYLTAEHAMIFVNRAGHGFDSAVTLTWPETWRFDDLCRVDLVDTRGLGCSSLVLHAPRNSPHHWRYDFVPHKPYLLTTSNNNMGQSTSIVYRSSAQEWLDEKTERLKGKKVDLTCHLPFALHLVRSQTQRDEITENQLTQRFNYRQGYYDSKERQLRGFGLLIESSSERLSSADLMPPSRTRQWFHTGQPSEPSRRGYDISDKHARPLGNVYVSRYQDAKDLAVEATDEATRRAIARALCGRLLRREVFDLGAGSKLRKLLQVEEHRYHVRLLTPQQVARDHVRVLPLELESINYNYDGFVADPQCLHTINARRDRFGAVEQSFQIHYARRLTASDTAPFDQVHESDWWKDAHDPAQQRFYISEHCAEYIHLSDDQDWRLGLPWRQRSQAYEAGKSTAVDGLNPSDINYEKFAKWLVDSGVAKTGVLTGLSVQRYQNARSGLVLPDGVAEFAGIGAYVETAEFDQSALRAFDTLAPDLRPDDALLSRFGYERMSDWLAPAGAQNTFWSVKSGFVTVASGKGFHKPESLQATALQGRVTVEHDAYHCCVLAIRQEDGCTTQARYDYRVMAPTQITDANGNINEVLMNPFGQVLASSVHGTEQGRPVGFARLSSYRRPDSLTPSSAIADPQGALQKATSVAAYDVFSWMGRIKENARRDIEWLKRCVAQGLLLPDGHICTRARELAASGARLSGDAQQLAALIQQAHREPVHTALLSADRYPDDQQQIHISLSCLDGFGRELQSKQKVDPGLAYLVGDDNRLVLVNDVAHESATTTRWCVTGRQEYNNKGLPIRIYRPYFADRHCYVKDTSMRTLDHYDLQHYDALGRPTETFLAKQGAISYLRRHRYHPWYSVMEDENDTLEEVMSATSKGVQA